jgi:hypothetical protein
MPRTLGLIGSGNTRHLSQSSVVKELIDAA